MFSILCVLGGLLEPNFTLDIPVNLKTGKIEIVNRARVEKGNRCPIDFHIDYVFAHGEYRNRFRKKYYTRAYQKKDVGYIFELDMEGYGKVLFVKDSKHTYRPMFGQEFSQIPVDGSGVAHPENVSVTSGGAHIIVTYLNGGKLVYKRDKLKCNCGDDHYTLEKEIDKEGRLICYTLTEEDILHKASRYDENRKEDGTVHIEDLLTKVAIHCEGDEYTYEFNMIDGKEEFVSFSKNGKRQISCEYKNGKLGSWIDEEDGIDMFYHVGGEKVSYYRHMTPHGKEEYSFYYYPQKTKICTGGEEIFYHYDDNYRLKRVDRRDGLKVEYSYYPDGSLRSKAYFNATGMFFSKSYEYDSKHNVIKVLEVVDGEESIYCYEYDEHLKREAPSLKNSPHQGSGLAPLVQKRLHAAFNIPYATSKKIYFVNGLATTSGYAKDCTTLMGQFFNQEITSYYRSDEGSVFSVIHEYLGSTYRAQNLAHAIMVDLYESEDDIYLFGHSAGGSTISTALDLLKDEDCKRIHVITFGSSSVISSKRVKSSVNYYSSRDYYMTMFKGIFGGVGDMTMIPSKTEDVFMDHSLMGPTYRDKWLQSLAEIQIE